MAAAQRKAEAVQRKARHGAAYMVRGERRQNQSSDTLPRPRQAASEKHFAEEYLRGGVIVDPLMSQVNARPTLGPGGS